ncbi:unnamed protein product [Diamesa serratosioi]
MTKKNVAFKKPTNSVQQRLKDACLKDSKVQSPVLQNPISDKKSGSNPHELIEKESTALPTSVKDETPKVKQQLPEDASVTIPDHIIDLINNVKDKRNWKHFEKPKVDKDGFFKATITDFSAPKLGVQSYIVSPIDLKDQYIAHLRQLQQVYKSSVLESLPYEKIKKKDLVVALFGITWHRAIVLEVDEKLIVLRSIETGCSCFIKDFSKIKAPLPAELQKKSFTIEVIFENGNDIDIDINSVVSIKMMSEMPGTNLATLKINNDVIIIESDDSDSSEDEELVRKLQAISIGTTNRDDIEKSSGVTKTSEVVTSLDVKTIESKSIDGRKYLNSQMIKDFHTGDKIVLTFLDGSQLSEGLAHFCEFRTENLEFYSKIDKEIKEYVANNVGQGNYKPVVNELVLAQFNDGLYYRGVCKAIKNEIALIYFLDYGGLENVEIEKIMKIPTNFLYTFCSHTCRVKLTDGDISKLDFEATVNKLFDKQHFQCKVEKLTGNKYPYLLTIANL